MVDPSKVAFWWPAGLKSFKEQLFSEIARKIAKSGGVIVKDDPAKILNLPDETTPIIGCHPAFRGAVPEWQKRGRPFIYWDRGYLMRWFATCLPQPASMQASYYRWHVNGFQMTSIRDVPDDRWKRLNQPVGPWSKGGRHIVIAAPTKAYAELHACENWLADTVTALAKVTDRQLVVRDKEQFRRRPLQMDLAGAHALVTHGSNAANEAIILGCPVFVDRSCAAALVGQTDLKLIEQPAYPDREPWLHSLAYAQFSEAELTDGTLWRLIQ